MHLFPLLLPPLELLPLELLLLELRLLLLPLVLVLELLLAIGSEQVALRQGELALRQRAALPQRCERPQLPDQRLGHPLSPYS